MDFQQTALTACGATVAYMVAYALYKRYRTTSISDIQGPDSPSWIYGHLLSWQCEEASVVEKGLLERFGAVARWSGMFGEQRLWLADPKAVHHVLQGSNMYEFPSYAMELIATITDRGLPAVEGDVHKRQRRALAPAFGLIEAKGLYPYFIRCFDSLADKWHEVVSNEPGQAATVDIHAWVAKATLDAIGAGAFDYDFGALEDSDNKLTKSYANLAFNTFGKPTRGRLFMVYALRYAPKGVVSWLLERAQHPGMVNLRENRTYAHEVAGKLIEEKKQEMKDGTSRRDLLSLLVKANSSLRPDWRLSDEEIVAQIRTIMFGGHDTTAKSLTIALWELARNRPVQERLRAEIVEKLREVRARGDSDFRVDDFDSMPYLLAVGKEILRVHPIAVEVLRVAKGDDVLPLSKPITGSSGKVYNELHIPAGTATYVSTVGYNMNKDIWGPDAYEFRPERWLEIHKKPESPVGVYSNLSTFSGGPRSCIGWRFAVVEMHTFLVILVRHFDFSIPENAKEVKRIRTGMITPVVIGEEDKGPQLPLKITALRDE